MRKPATSSRIASAFGPSRVRRSRMGAQIVATNPVWGRCGRLSEGGSGASRAASNRRETEAECQQLVLLAHRPGAGEAEALAQPQHRLEALDRAPGRVEGLKAADPRHGSLDPEV